jgi:RNA polymerase sigma-70 factor, ECF subfamily
VTPIDVQELSRQYLPRIHRAALVLSGNPWDADDLAQETFLVFARTADRFEGRSNLYTWLYGILLNLDRRRRRRDGVRRRRLRVLWDNEPMEERVSPAADLPLEAAEWKRSLWAEVARLPDGQREVLVLRYSEHLSYAEIAGVLDCPLGTVKSRIFNGLASLKNQFTNQGDESDAVPNEHRTGQHRTRKASTG